MLLWEFRLCSLRIHEGPVTVRVDGALTHNMWFLLHSWTSLFLERHSFPLFMITLRPPTPSMFLLMTPLVFLPISSWVINQLAFVLLFVSLNADLDYTVDWGSQTYSSTFPMSLAWITTQAPGFPLTEKRLNLEYYEHILG